MKYDDGLSIVKSEMRTVRSSFKNGNVFQPKNINNLRFTSAGRIFCGFENTLIQILCYLGKPFTINDEI